MESMKQSFQDDMTTAKTGLLVNSKVRFVASTLCKVEPQLRADLPIPTACADGKNIYVDPEFWKSLNVKQQMRSIFHEGFHNLMGHCDIKLHTKTEHMLHNIAADCVTESFATLCNVGEGKYCEGTINPTNGGNVVLHINGKKLVINGCHDRTVEDIYELLKQHVKENPPKKGDTLTVTDEAGVGYNPIDNHELREHSAEERNEREQTLRQALVEHKLKGTMPGALADMIEKMLKGKVNWKAELRDMILPEVKSYLSCKKRNRRSGSFDVIIPGNIKEGIEVTIAIDTSGSIGQKEIMYYLGEITNLFKQFDSNTVTATILMHHSRVYATYDVSDIRDISKLQTESGGTSHINVFEIAEEINSKVLICLTDGFSDFPENTRMHKTLWIVTDHNGLEKIPDNLGKKILVPIEELQED